MHKGFCCEDNCSLDALDVYVKRRTFLWYSSKERREFYSGRSYPSEGLCQTCFRLVYDIPKATFYNNLRRYQSGRAGPQGRGAGPVVSAEHGNTGSSKRAGDSLLAIARILKYAKQAGDYMPDCNEIHLPDYSWKMVMKKLILDSPTRSGLRVSQPNFYKLLALPQLEHVKIVTCKRFAACQYCLQLKANIRSSTGRRREFWEDELRKHNDWQMRERLKQAKHVEKATNPSTHHKYMVIMIDSMDHSKSSLPHFQRPPKDLESAEQLDTHVTGIHVPGWKERPITCYTWHDRFPTGSDSVITFLMKILCDYSQQHTLPENLFLHMDNCWRENKNRFMLGIAHLLVEKGCFKRVDLCFLPVGHTHNIVDQMFSRFATALAAYHEGFFTVEDVHRICFEGYSAVACSCGTRWNVGKTKTTTSKKCPCDKVGVHFEHIDKMACWGPTLKKFMTSQIAGISKPRYYRVERDKAGVVRHRYRHQLQSNRNAKDRKDNEHAGCTPEAIAACVQDKLEEPSAEDLQWMPYNRPGFQMFPSGFPDLEAISVPKVALKSLELDKLQETHRKLAPYLSEEADAWWAGALQQFKQVRPQQHNYNKNVSDNVNFIALWDVSLSTLTILLPYVHITFITHIM